MRRGRVWFVAALAAGTYHLSRRSAFSSSEPLRGTPGQTLKERNFGRYSQLRSGAANGEKSSRTSLRCQLGNEPLAPVTALERAAVGLLALVLGLVLSWSPGPVRAEDLERDSVEAAWGFISRNFYDQTYNGQDWNAAHQRYLERSRKGEKAAALTREMVDSLGDRFSRVIDAGTFEQLMAYDPLGVGLVLTRNQEKEVFVSSPPFKGSSADKAGIKQGDFVDAVDGASLKEQSLFGVMDRVSQADSSQVKLSLRRGSSSDSPSAVSARSWEETLGRKRQAAPQNQVVYGVVTANRPGGHKVGYLRLRNFGARSALETRDALVQLRGQGAEELVLDVRGNPGGSFSAALEIAELFLEPGSVATQVKTPQNGIRAMRVGEGAAATSAAVAKEPLVVLVDGGSASASEVLAVALRGNCRAALVGAHTYGKAAVQGVFGLPNQEALALTVARYSGPGGNSIEEGLEPDAPGPGGSLPRGFLPGKGGGTSMAAVASLLGLPAQLQAGEYASLDIPELREAALKSCRAAEVW